MTGTASGMMAGVGSAMAGSCSRYLLAGSNKNAGHMATVYRAGTATGSLQTMKHEA